MAHVLYDNFRSLISSAGLDWVNDELHLILVQETNPSIITSAGMVGDTMTSAYSGTSATPLTETSGVNYTAGGVVLSGTSAIKDAEIVRLTAGNINWYNATLSAGGYLITTSADNYLSASPLIYADFAVKRVAVNDTFSILFEPSGIIRLEQG